MTAVRHLGFVIHTRRSSHEEYLVVFSIVHNLVGISFLGRCWSSYSGSSFSYRFSFSYIVLIQYVSDGIHGLCGGHIIEAGEAHINSNYCKRASTTYTSACGDVARSRRSCCIGADLEKNIEGEVSVHSYTFPSLSFFFPFFLLSSSFPPLLRLFFPPFPSTPFPSFLLPSLPSSASSLIPLPSFPAP